MDCPPWVCQKVLIKGLAIKRQLAVFHGKILLLQGEEINGRSSVKTWRTTSIAINTVKREILCLRGATVLVHTEFARVIKV